MTINERISEIIRSDKNLSQKKMGESIGVSQSTANYWMNGNRAIPAEYIVPIADYLGVSYDYLLTGAERPPEDMSDKDKEWFKLIHDLPEDAEPVVRGMVEGYLKGLK